ncbi:MAG: hypothetical protein ACRD8Z_22990, partial [Nitrososphaeraceae archaeon]
IITILRKMACGNYKSIRQGIVGLVGWCCSCLNYQLQPTPCYYYKRSCSIMNNLNLTSFVDSGVGWCMPVPN